jgi:hypothetical protein
MNTTDVPDGLLLDYRLDSGVTVVKVTGEVDVSTSSSLRNSLLRVITDETHHSLVVNLASVSFLDSTGLGVLVGYLAPRLCHPGLSGPGRAVPPGPRHPGNDRPDQGTSIYDTEAAAVQVCREPTAR